VPRDPLSDSLGAEMAALLPESSREQIALIAHRDRKTDLSARAAGMVCDRETAADLPSSPLLGG